MTEPFGHAKVILFGRRWQEIGLTFRKILTDLSTSLL